MGVGAEDVLERAVAWAREEERVDALVVHGSVAKGTADADSDLDLVVVARPGARDGLWARRAELAARLLDGEPVWANELPWQRPYRYQAWRGDLLMLDLTLDEGDAVVWSSVREARLVPFDRAGVGERLERSARAAGGPDEFDAPGHDGGTWAWLNWLSGRLRQGRCWFVAHGVDDTLNTRVLPLWGSTPYEAGADALAAADWVRLREARPASLEAAELARALVRTAALYEDALARWAERTGRPMVRHPLAAPVRARLVRRAAHLTADRPPAA